MPSNDNERVSEVPAPRSAEAHGHAALILIESLIHGLIERSALTTHESLEIVTSALDVQADYVAAGGDAVVQMRHAEVLLSSIAGSLHADL